MSGWLSYGRFLVLKRRFGFPIQRFAVRVLFVYDDRMLAVAWVKPVLMAYKPYQLVATFGIGNDFLAGSYYLKAEVFVVILKPEQVGLVIEALPLACLGPAEQEEWAKKIESGSEVKCRDYSGLAWA